jgi:hypothetical protein
MNLLRPILLGLALAIPAVAIAQWQWIDKDGRKVFSDQSPPADIPAKNILRQPGGKPVQAAAEPVAAASAAAPSAAAASGSAATAAATPKLSGKDKELEAKKKAAEAAEANKKKAQEEEVAKGRADNCARAKVSKDTFNTGVRVSRVNDKGEREFMDENARVAEMKRLDMVIARDCKPAGG